ncbi:hypothetical protein PsYK624_163630 [Phanerochaete sordida]|uniref:DUF6532 domain-containing protein n=1 Tax=Phanerochaete sordida TaxID=48140 RepID=A0A9P3GQP2_9APHY|nr:hypothetical protein PsYK624_163630 [Phanerochaete sordida]
MTRRSQAQADIGDQRDEKRQKVEEMEAEAAKTEMHQPQPVIVFENAFPDASGPQLKLRWLRKILLDAAEDTQQTDVRQELLANSRFLKALCVPLETRMCIFRSHFRAIMASKVGAHYGLMVSSVPSRGQSIRGRAARGEASCASDAAIERLEKLFEHSRYMYPVDSTGNFKNNKPYAHPIFVDGLAEFLFASRRPFIMKHAAAFEVEWQGDRRTEVPAPLLALLATAVYAALLDYKNRLIINKKPADFSADAFAETYGGHLKALQEVERAKPRAYHQMLEDMFQQAQCGRRATSTDAVAADILEGLDLDMLPEDD